MFRKGDVVENPVTGEKATVRVGTRESRGQQLIVDVELRGAGFGLPLHVHPALHERITVVSGRIGVLVNGESAVREAGAMIDIPPGTPHRFWNAGICVATVAIDIQPAKRFEAFIRNMVGLAQDGKTNQKGMPHLLQLAVIATEFDDVVRFCRPPRLLQMALFPLLAAIARLYGYRNLYSGYLLRRPATVHRHKGALPLLKQH